MGFIDNDQAIEGCEVIIDGALVDGDLGVTVELVSTSSPDLEYQVNINIENTSGSAQVYINSDIVTPAVYLRLILNYEFCQRTLRCPWIFNNLGFSLAFVHPFGQLFRRNIWIEIRLINDHQAMK